MAGSLIQVDKFVVTSDVATVTLGGGSSGSSGANASINTDDVYMVVVNNWVPATATVVTRLRVTKSGSADVTANYDFAGIYANPHTGFTTQGNSNNTDFEFSFTGTTSGSSTNCVMYLYNFNSSSEFSMGHYETSHSDHSVNHQGLTGGFVHTVASASDGIEFRFHSGNIASGDFTLYKIQS